MHRTFHRSFHRGYLAPRCAASSHFSGLAISLPWRIDFERASIVATNWEGASPPFSFCSFIAVVRRLVYINRSLSRARSSGSVARNAVRSRVGEREWRRRFFFFHLSIVHRCRGRNKQVSFAQRQCCGTHGTTRFTSSF